MLCEDNYWGWDNLECVIGNGMMATTEIPV